MRLLDKGQLVLRGIDIREVARKQLVSMSARTGQTTHLVILEGKEGVYIDKVEGEKAAIRYSRIGRSVPLHSSAVGKALLAFLDPQEIDAILNDYDYVVQTPKTIRDRDTLLEELERIRRNGYSVDDEENEPGVRCAATPIRDHTGAVVAAVSVSTMVSAVDDTLFQHYVTLLQEEARSISTQLGYKL
jgi:DNA-binding IclR family transcriptional regulator